jgi:hypothetical protein
MADAMSFSQFADYAIVAELRCGSDGSPYGIPELAVGSSYEDEDTARFMWDDDLTDGFDSGWVGMELEVSASGDVSWFVDHVMVAHTTAAFDEVLGFIFRVGVNTPDSTVSFRNIAAAFFVGESDATANQVVVQDDGTATTVGSTSPDAEDIVLMGPDGSGYQKARIFAEVRMQSPDLPTPTDLFGQVFVYTQ